MAGQFPSGTFDVTGLQVTFEEQAHHPTPPLSMDIIDYGETFDLTVALEGTGTAWRNVCDREIPFEVRYYAEGIGTAPDLDLGVVSGNLVSGKYAYGFSDNETTLRVAGGITEMDAIFKLAASVTFPGEYGLLGYTEGPMIQISHLEERL